MLCNHLTDITQHPRTSKTSVFCNHYIKFPLAYLNVNTDFFPSHSCAWKMFCNNNGGTELSIRWNSTEFGNLLLKVKFVNFQTK
jgi:hypothetical protein